MNRLALGGVFAPVLFAVVVTVLAFMRPDYSHIVNFISELGALGTPNALVMNYIGFVPTGLLFVGLGISLTRLLPWSWYTLIASALVILFGTGVAASGLFSCDVGCPQDGGTRVNSIHNTIAPIAFLCLIAATGIFGFYFRRLDAWRPLSVYSYITSVVAFGFFMVLGSSLETRTVTGLWQRLLLATLFLWCAVVGARAFRLDSLMMDMEQ